MPQSAEAGCDVQRHEIVGSTTRKPRPRSVRVLTFGQLIRRSLQFILQTILLKQHRHLAASLTFVLSGSQPRRFGDQHVANVFVFLQRAIQRVGATPLFKNAFDFWLAGNDVPPKCIGVQTIEHLFVALMWVFHQVR